MAAAVADTTPADDMSAAKLGRAKVVVASLALFALVGCGADRTDPRDGVVTIDESNCLFGDCYSLTEVCIAGDLHTTYSDGYGDDDVAEVERDSERCLP